MKNAIIIITCSFLAFKPLWPVAEYALNYDYISKKLCENEDQPELQCNGKCYLSKKLAAISDEEHNPYENNLQEEIQEVLICQTMESVHGILTSWGRLGMESNYLGDLDYSCFLSILTPPPQDS